MNLVGGKTLYKWLQRAQQGQPLSDHSRRPKHSTAQCAPQLEQQVCTLRKEHPAWGARKLTHRLRALGIEVAAPSTVHAILRRKRPGNASSTSSPTICGRWTSKVTWQCLVARAATR